MIYCGPTEWRFERRRGSSMDRKNTVRHLIQMMAITEEQDGHHEAGGGDRGTSPAPGSGGGGGGAGGGGGSSSAAAANLQRAGLDLESKIPPEFLVSKEVWKFFFLYKGFAA